MAIQATISRETAMLLGMQCLKDFIDNIETEEVDGDYVTTSYGNSRYTLDEYGRLSFDEGNMPVEVHARYTGGDCTVLVDKAYNVANSTLISNIIAPMVKSVVMGAHKVNVETIKYEKENGSKD